MKEPSSGERVSSLPGGTSTEAADRTSLSRRSVVLELFTSEGCSSCPPADETLATIADEAEASGARIFTLELHVDYWNRLGWIDPFSDAIHSARQGAYAGRFGASGVYTPQLVVNGREELVGSNEPGARSAIARALTTPATASVSLSAQRRPGSLEIAVHVVASKPGDLLLAVAEDRAETRVTAGENSDRVLRHRHVVREFRKVRVNATDDIRWQPRWPPAGSASTAFVAAYVSDPGTLEVGAADAVLVAP